MARLIGAVLVVLGLVLPVLGNAAVVQVPTEAALVQTSDAIVMGSVVGVKATLQPQGGVATTVSVRVFDSLRGVAPSETISVVVPGGKLDNGLTSYVAGSPRASVGDWVVLLLERKAQVWTPRGLSLGWIYLRGNERHGFVAYRDLSGLSVLKLSGGLHSSNVYHLAGEPWQKVWNSYRAHLEQLRAPQNFEVRP